MIQNKTCLYICGGGVGGRSRMELSLGRYSRKGFESSSEALRTEGSQFR